MEISIEKGSWKTLEHPASAVRLMVFVAEQKVPKEEEIDALDPVSTHFVARDSRHMAVGTARLTPDGRIGRLAVLKPFRGRGVGAKLLEAALDCARDSGLREVTLHALVHARGFYEKYGFEAEGRVFDECGIDHILMRLRLC
ncbi:GNAT family N-acetyltransferase [uncultured Sutterella sp.]|uniref:GNAT family N-acetyltransferase n=1 Tax=uncultured Sutterella sp. TaxID=286133 RepID=UPI00259BC359|nr:GNAT family N-acetyltransferase [uncultured Sutterella sp.]